MRSVMNAPEYEKSDVYSKDLGLDEFAQLHLKPNYVIVRNNFMSVFYLKLYILYA